MPYLTGRGVEFEIDDNDYDIIKDVIWYIDAYGYLQGKVLGKSVLMHRLITDTSEGVEVDHINGNKLDNRRVNLRFATRQQNSRNTRLRVDNKSGYKGVHFQRSSGKYRATIGYDGKKINLGLFDDPSAAHDAYKQAALKYHKEFHNFG